MKFIQTNEVKGFVTNNRWSCKKIKEFIANYVRFSDWSLASKCLTENFKLEMYESSRKSLAFSNEIDSIEENSSNIAIKGWICQGFLFSQFRNKYKNCHNRETTDKKKLFRINFLVAPNVTKISYFPSYLMALVRSAVVKRSG